MPPALLEYKITTAYSTAANHTYTCIRCGWQWARLTLNPKLSWISHVMTCRECPTVWPSEVPGSLVMTLEARLKDGHGVAHLPREAVWREIELHAGIDTATESGHNTPIQSTEAFKMTTDLESRIAELRSKVLAGTATDSELREGLRALRAERFGSSVRRVETKAKATPIDGGALLAKLMGAASKTS
jgi:hypothetical protein